MIRVIAWNELHRRLRDRSVLIGCLAAPLLMAAVLGLWWLLVGTVMTMLLLHNRGEEWANDETKSVATLAAAVLPELLAVLQFTHWPS